MIPTQLEQLLRLDGLKDMHNQIHTADIKRIPKNNDKENTIQA